MTSRPWAVVFVGVAVAGLIGAHVLRKRPMEVFERIGVAREIRQAAPGLSLDYIVWCASLAGREVGSLDLRVGLP